MDVLKWLYREKCIINPLRLQMFGLEDQKKKKTVQPFVFDLEKELKNKQKLKEIRQMIEERIQDIKKVLRSGENSEEFDQFGVLLHGYTSFLKVISRFSEK